MVVFLALFAWTALWTRDVGPGFAGPLLADGKLLLFHRIKGEEVLECLEARTGKLLWKTSYPTAYRDDFGFDEGPRSTPVVAGGRVFTHGAEGVLQAVELATGKRLWSIPTMQQYAVEKNWFGAGGSPTVFDKVVMLNVGGAGGAGIIGFDAATGKELWKATSDPAAYSTGVIAGGRAYFLTRTGLVVLEPSTGKVIHQSRWRARSNASVNAASPIVVDDEVFLSSSYGVGATVLKAGDSWKALWSSDDALSNHYASSVAHDGFLYGFHGRQEEGQSFRCVEWKSGKVMWSQDSYGAGTVLLDGSRLLIVRESGEVVSAPASPKSFQPASLGRPVAGIVRAYPAISGKLLCVRNSIKMACGELP